MTSTNIAARESLAPGHRQEFRPTSPRSERAWHPIHGLDFSRESQGKDKLYAKHVVNVSIAEILKALRLEEPWERAHPTAALKGPLAGSKLGEWQTSLNRKSGATSSASPPPPKRQKTDRRTTRWGRGRIDAPPVPMQEDALLQDISNFFDPRSGIDAPSAFYDFSNTPPCPYEDVCLFLKPYAVVLDLRFQSVPKWSNIRGLIACTSSSVSDTKPESMHQKIRELVVNLQRCLKAQPSRQHVLGISLHKTKSKRKNETGEDEEVDVYAHEVIAVTRSQVFVVKHSNTISEEGIVDLAAWLNLLRTTDLVQLGHLPAFSLHRQTDLFSSCRVVMIDSKEWRLQACLQAAGGSPFSRCTSVWRVKRVREDRSAEEEEPECILKLFWAHASDSSMKNCDEVPREVQVLQYLRLKAKRNGALAARVPILQAWEVLGHPIGHNNPLPRTPLAIIFAGEGCHISTESLPNRGALLDFLIDLWEGYLEILRAGVAHKDLSLNNVMVRKSQNGVVGAFFIDFGASVRIDGDFRPHPDWVSRANAATMTPDCASYAIAKLGGSAQYQYSARQDVESLMNVLSRTIMRISPFKRPLQHTSISSVSTSSHQETSGAQNQSVSSPEVIESPLSVEPLILVDFDASTNTELLRKTHDYVVPLDIASKKRGFHAPSVKLLTLIGHLQDLDKQYSIHPSDEEQRAWLEAYTDDRAAPSTYLDTPEISTTMLEVIKCIKNFKNELEEWQLQAPFSSDASDA